jgi:hypothetical protein
MRKGRINVSWKNRTSGSSVTIDTYRCPLEKFLPPAIVVGTKKKLSMSNDTNQDFIEQLQKKKKKTET